MDGTLQRARQIYMEQWPIQSVHNCHFDGIPRIRLTAPEILGELSATGAGVIMGYWIASAYAPRPYVFHVLRPLAFELFFVFVKFRRGCGAQVPSDLRNAEDGFPALEG